MRNPEKIGKYAQNMRKYAEICAAHIPPPFILFFLTKRICFFFPWAMGAGIVDIVGSREESLKIEKKATLAQ
jgi:hypothetical protein